MMQKWGRGQGFCRITNYSQYDVWQRFGTMDWQDYRHKPVSWMQMSDVVYDNADLLEDPLTAPFYGQPLRLFADDGTLLCKDTVRCWYGYPRFKMYALNQEQRPDRPFFLYLPYNAPHYGKGYDPGKREVVNIMQAKPEDLARASQIEDPTRRVFAAMTLSLDDGIGKVLATLEQQGLRENTLVIFMTDNGGDPDYGGSSGPLRGEKGTLFEGGIRVPCLMRWPGKLNAGSTCDAVCSSLDLFPTFCRLCGADPSKFPLDGIDLIPQLLEGGASEDRELFWELSREGALRRGSWKYLRTADGSEYLFDLDDDPLEKNNLSEQRSEVFAQLKTRHAQIARECLNP